MGKSLLLTVFVLFSVSGWAVSRGRVPANCKVGQDCLIDVEESSCGDGTRSFFQLTQRTNAKKLLIYLNGGGGCWDKKTCESGFAKSLTRVESYIDWNGGKGIFDSRSEKNPFKKEFNIVSIPYCTGDAHTGSRISNYGSESEPYTVRHMGYQNVVKTLEKVKALFPDPEKVVLLGCSAGGIGAYYHLRNVVKQYPMRPTYVVSDAGTPFKPPYVYEANYRNIMKRWGVDKTLPPGLILDEVADFGEVIHFNTVRYPEVRFSFLSSYRDIVMTFFALSVGSPSAQTAVKKIIIDVADNDIGRDAEFQKVFYTDSSRHCHTGEDLETIQSGDADLGSWLNAMVSDEKGGWENRRPDLHRSVKAYEGALPTLKEIQDEGLL